MKKIIFLLTIMIGVYTFTSCDDNEWEEGDPSMEHIYYIGFKEWGKFNNKVKYNVEQGGILEVPIQYHSERIRSYDVVTYYYVGDEMQRGVDYEIIDEEGKAIEPNQEGAYTVTWSKAKKGIYNIRIKALNAQKGSFTLHTFNPKAGEIKHPDNITNSMTKDYEVRSFTQNYKVIVNIK